MKSFMNKAFRKYYISHLSTIFFHYMIVSLIVILCSIFSFILFGFVTILVLTLWFGIGMITLGILFFNETFVNIPSSFFENQDAVFQIAPYVCFISLIISCICAASSLVCLLTDLHNKNNRPRIIITSIVSILSIIGIVVILIMRGNGLNGI